MIGPNTQPRRILIVGESNPYGDDPEFALYPLPEYASGGRLARILGLSRTEYLRRHDRVNLCTGTWSIKAAEQRALALHAERPAGTGIVLCGAKVALAFRRAGAYTPAEFLPLSRAEHGGRHYLVLPHPSGLCRAWGVPGTVEAARAAYEALWADVSTAQMPEHRP